MDRRRLAKLEQAAAERERAYWLRYEASQRALGLPLPPGADIDEGVRRIRDCLQRTIGKSADEQAAIMSEFRSWVDEQRERFGQASNGG